MILIIFIIEILQMSTSARDHVQQLGGGQPLAPGAGAEGLILGLDLAQVMLACPAAMLAHLEKIYIIWHNCCHEKR